MDELNEIISSHRDFEIKKNLEEINFLDNFYALKEKFLPLTKFEVEY